ncbi:hypothetical protein Mal52_31690 [Symmachiella dynata]|uniref:DUF1501 domain-containing protein n=1 Tax=Symmachiella dynata TaxID=2527995 RepID=A0A517ZQJ0_9PLAN|nr:DUF1501 domain-containing protein [Symmachiella dynata]QDU44683.1 hypothetical protein Mal52_31690 [Symmachiella dynata]
MARMNHVNRRQLLRVGLTGFTGLTLPGLYRARAESNPTAPASETAIILVWLRGGQSHLDTFDMKPLAPSDYRGPFNPVDTNVPGIQITELYPRLSQCADRFALLRSVAHNAGGHPSGSLRVLGGDPATADKTTPTYPDWMSIASYLRHNSTQQLPNYIAINPVDRYDSFQIAGPAYLGPSYEPFQVTGDPNKPEFTVPNVGLRDPNATRRLNERGELRRNIDRMRRDIDQTGLMRAFDDFDAQALRLLSSPEAARAFDLSLEADKLRDRYGRNLWGQQCLMARRLVEAGVDIVATEFDGPLCGRVANWDDHAVNHHVFDANAYRAPFFDQAISALIEDVYDRGLDKRVMVVVTGEFGRTPRISHVASSGGGVASAPKGTVQPGRDHWPRANTMLFAGGGIQTGQVIGATDARGEDPISRHVTPYDFLMTIFHHLGFDHVQLGLKSFAGRRNPIFTKGDPIRELSRTA